MDETDEWYNVYTPEFDTAIDDELDPAQRFHTGIFVETDPQNEAGDFFHVKGDIISSKGMAFEAIPEYHPRTSNHLHKITQVGRIRKADYSRARAILEALPRPIKQQGIDFWSEDPEKKNKMTWTKENGEVYGPDEQRRPIMKCNEWTHQVAIPRLQSEGILCSSI